ncbi:peptidoglycan-binding protein [Leisingera daeponensis]|uniref:Peptidoglycan-binding protein n=1 Tax=Leisingera daeponensis TaxID=405746 RepID=A0ABS7NCL3_9RHOB|nr:peptidoglycan-binding domain-containing protein [Leisingera daeponensis]MBY6057289.1 peptidoglycan-binding protein [Leisingera daeponensis]MBY6138949.1 peptidoglycan-binding protein [Leisingera daeponensis]
MMPPISPPWRRLAPALLLAALAALPACVQPPPGGPGSPLSREGRYAPPGAPPDTCWSRHTSPAVIETVTSQVLDAPAQLDASGRVVRPAAFRTETRQHIVTPRQEHWIEIPCPAMMTPDFIRTIQRALAARGLYRGPVHGQMDAATRKAVQRYQAPLGLDSGTLTLASARKLGLVAVAG